MALIPAEGQGCGPFLSSVLEKAVSTQLLAFMSHNNIFETFQSGFKALHSTETALLKVSNDFRLAAVREESAILIILDSSAAFDTVDYAILLDRMKTWVGIKGNACSWFYSYLLDRTFPVTRGNYSSTTKPVTCWCTAKFYFRSYFIFYLYAPTQAGYQAGSLLCR